MGINKVKKRNPNTSTSDHYPSLNPKKERNALSDPDNSFESRLRNKVTAATNTELKEYKASLNEAKNPHLDGFLSLLFDIAGIAPSFVFAPNFTFCVLFLIFIAIILTYILVNLIKYLSDYCISEMNNQRFTNQFLLRKIKRLSENDPDSYRYDKQNCYNIQERICQIRRIVEWCIHAENKLVRVRWILFKVLPVLIIFSLFMYTQNFPDSSAATIVPNIVAQNQPEDNLDRTDNISVTPTAIPVPVHETANQMIYPTVTPLTSDESEDSYNTLYGIYLMEFDTLGITSVSEAQTEARRIIEETWERPGCGFHEIWQMEQMDIYGWPQYKPLLEWENRLRSSDSYTADTLYITSCQYLSATSEHISSGQAISPRTLGLACLRGIDVTFKGIQDGTVNVAASYNNAGYLLRHYADSLPFDDKKTRFSLYTFSEVCYEKAFENGNHTAQTEAGKMLTSMENNQPDR